ncbi:MAG: hypothetical protein JXQ65_08770 [Candidatus Marinimicrobia bacterium]|nr:hypothetical protein [Candidatus Neomarinimicrobiota bacterium]
MINEKALKKVELKVFRLSSNDGLFDFFLGCFVLMFAVAPLLSSSLGDFWSSIVFLPFWVIIYFVLLLIKKMVILPRTGRVKFGESHRKKMRKFHLIMFITNLFVLIIGAYFVVTTRNMAGWVPGAIFGFAVLVLSSVAAYFFNYLRIFIYGLVMLLAFLIGERLFIRFQFSHHGYPVAFGITSFAIMISGIILFIRFLKKYPLPEIHSEEELV